MRRWLFEIEGGHGRTQWIRRRIIEDTRPSIVDPVSVLDAAHGSHRVTQKEKKRSSEGKMRWLFVFMLFSTAYGYGKGGQM